MQEYTVCAVYDSGAALWRPPMFVVSAGEAVRQFRMMVNLQQEGNIFAMHPSDFTLFKRGSWSDVDCKFDLLEAPVQLARGADLVRALPHDVSGVPATTTLGGEHGAGHGSPPAADGVRQSVNGMDASFTDSE